MGNSIIAWFKENTHVQEQLIKKTNDIVWREDLNFACVYFS